jgi:outer membrane protein OmpA-like peptidoglycan-associated protein
MLNELLRHIKCNRLEAERANARGLAQSSREANGGVRAHASLRKARQLDFRAEASRSTILKGLDAMLEARDTPHGLVVTLSDDLFDNLTLRSVACEKLGRIAHFLLSHPGVRFGAEVHTTGTGSEEDDERISAERVFDLMRYFVRNGVPDLCISAGGLVGTDGIQGHNRAGGRQARRVELLVSGKATGTKLRGAAAAA